MKLFHLLIAVLFVLFAVVQWNDPDPLLWIVVYLIISVVALLAFRDRHYFWFNLVFTMTLLVSTSFYVVDVIEWWNDDMPSITESMKASSPYIERIREFFGLITALVAMTFYLVLSKKIKL